MKLIDRKGFTLLELLVVISIIGFLATIVLSSLNSARLEASKNTFKSELQQLNRAMQIYWIDAGEFPEDQYPRSDIYDMDQGTETSTELSQIITQGYRSQIAPVNYIDTDGSGKPIFTYSNHQFVPITAGQDYGSRPGCENDLIGPSGDPDRSNPEISIMPDDNPQTYAFRGKFKPESGPSTFYCLTAAGIHIQDDGSEQNNTDNCCEQR